MRTSARQLLIPAFLAVVTAAIYLPDLQGAPPFLTNDEVCIALNARSIATTGHDVNGRFMPSLFYSPAYFAPNRPRIWFLPILVYVTALVLKVLPFSETAIRLPLVLAAIADVLLVYFITRLLTRRTAVAVIAALLLALTPSHFVHARLALPAQISGPFVLAWLLCVLVYLERSTPNWLFASGVLLGSAAIGYIGPLVLVYGLLTWAVVSQRHERWPHYAAVVAGGLVPCLYFFWLARDPGVVQEILGHYQQPAIGNGLVAGLGNAAILYWNFWRPDFLFVEGALRNARAAGAIGVFLLPLAGLITLGIARALRHRDAVSILLLGGLLSAPLTASFVGENHAIWRALGVAPFGVLLAALGLDLFMDERRSASARWTAYLVAFGVPIVLGYTYHYYLRHAQPMIRILIAPLAIALLAMLIRKLPAGISFRSVLAAGICVAIVQAAYVTRFADVVNVLVPVLALIALPLVSDETAIVALLALLAGELLYMHVDYPPVSRIGSLPASAVLMAMRTATLAVGLGLAAGTAALARRALAPSARLRPVLTSAIVGVIVVQLAYFYVGYVVERPLRLTLAVSILVGAMAAAALLASIAGDRRTFTRLGTATLLASAVVQFGHFYVDYLTEFPDRNVNMAAGNVRLVWERVIEDAARRDPPAVFVGPVGAYDDAGLYWRFYLIKHHREDLLVRTIENVPFDRARIQRLLPGSVIVASPSPDVDRVIRDLQGAGDIAREDDDLIRAPDGTALSWKLTARD
jgi:4-amino-4-deoxy-L-arabinose transferase-like glycosyltransferase